MTKLLLILFLSILCSCSRIQKHEKTCKVLSIEKQIQTVGNKNHIHTDIYWLVVTDDGTYRIVSDGLWACPEAVGILQKDSIYRLTIDGFYESRFWEMYPFIVHVEPLIAKKGSAR